MKHFAHRQRFLFWGLICIAVTLGVVGPLWAQPPPAPTAGNAAGITPPEPEVAPDSPRASMREFVALCRAGEHEEAAQFLDIPPTKSKDAASLVRKLKSILDRHVLLDSDLLLVASPHSWGNTSDKLPPGVDEIGAVPGPKGPEPVRIVRRATAQRTLWVFSRSTVERVDVWYARLSERWLFDALPEPLLRPGPFEILYWQYVALTLLLAVAWLIGKVFGFLTRKAIGKVVLRTASKWDDALVERIGPPLALAWGLGTFAGLLPTLGLYEPARETVQKGIRAGFLIALFWSGLRAVDVARSYFVETAGKGAVAARSLVPLGAQLFKLLMFAGAFVMVLSELGYPVASLIAGLGIGGIALALAAQKTVENLFGSLSIGIDQPFGVGDTIKVDEMFGTVETVGLRSTRIRTLDRTLVTIPNGKLADMRIETFSVRDRFRLFATLGLVYGTTAEQLRGVLNGIETVLKEEPTFYGDEYLIFVKGFGPSSIDIDVSAWFNTASWSEFTKVRQAMLLRFMEVIAHNETAFAYPTQTVHLVNEKPA